MPTITIRDEQGDELFTSDLKTKGLGKHLKSAASLRTLLGARQTLGKAIADLDGGRALDLALETDVPIGKESALSINAGAQIAVGIHPSGGRIAEGADLQAPVHVPNGTTFASLIVEAGLKAGLSSTKAQFGFGFQAGTAVRYGYFHPFDTAAGSPTVKDALASLFAGATFPSDVEDLKELPVGAFVSVAGEGELAFNAQVRMSSMTNLLATPGLPLVGSATLVQGASVGVDAAWTASGEFEMRASKASATTVHLEFYRRRGRSLSVSARASAGLSLEARGRDLLAALMKAISPDPEADLIALVNAGLSDDQIVAIQQAIAASVDRSLTLSAQLQVSALRENEALFGYTLDLARLGSDGTAAVNEALRGKLTALDALAEAGNGITMTASAATRLRTRKTSWRINLLGILNFAGFTELVRAGSVTCDPVSGALTAADQISTRRIRVASQPLQSDPEKLRRVIFESLMVTAAYQAGRSLGASVTLAAEQTYMEQFGRTKRRDLEDHYRALIALGLCDTAERDARLASEVEFGPSIFLIENDFDAAACDAMFFDGDGQPHAMEHYEKIGRQALLALLPADDPLRAFRRTPLAADSVWGRVRDLGGEIDAALGHLPPAQRAIAAGDIVTIMWWARAMSTAAVKLAEMRKFLGSRDAATLRKDPAFTKARTKLEEALANVIKTTGARFDDPWDMLAMDAAAARQGTLEAVIISTRFAVRYSDLEVPVPEPRTMVRRSGSGMGERAGAMALTSRSAAAERDWTTEERDIFSRHVVNLGAGKLSSDGSFVSTREQVEEMFKTHIPAYVARQRAAGAVPRVLFFAHGGLVDEREGLLPVLARRRFWDLNGIYPVYFVWETGIRETLGDIFGRLVPGARAGARGALTDLAIENVARRGREVWSQMKRNAETAAGAQGGSRLVAELAGQLWKANGGGIEFHALGHSAGAILHSHFLPLLAGQRLSGVPPVDVRSLHLLAPAANLALFKAKLRPLVGAGKPITRLTMYTMTDELETKDSSLKPYGKSLLYLVSRAFEDDVPTSILGLQDSLKRDLDMIRFFGLAGTDKVANVIFSRTLASAPINARSEAAAHGAFDNDIATMTSVVRQMLDVPNSDEVVDYFEEAVPGFDRAAVGVPPGAIAARAERAPAIRAARRGGTAQKQWTFMVWMAGDNDLEDFGDKDLKEMRRIGSTGEVDVVVQFDSMRDDRTRRYHVTRGSGAPDDDIVEEIGETNTGDPAVAVDFFSWAIERYPAERLAAVIWNHGSGIDETDIYARAARRGVPIVGRGAPGGLQRQLVRTAVATSHRRALFATTVEQAVSDRAIAYDDTAKDFLDNLELKKVLVDVKRRTGRTLDLLAFDACLMNMVEVAYQVRGTAHVMVGSEELEPGDGWPYDRVLESLVENPALTAAELGAIAVDRFVDSYRSGNVTQSALDLSRVEDLRGAIDALAEALTKALRDATEYTAVTKALNATQRFDTADFVDLGSFCSEIAKRSKVAGVKTAAKAVVEALGADEGFVLAERHKGTDVSRSTGVAIYFPRGPVNKTYKRLDFAKDGSWAAFLTAYHKP